MKQTAQLLRGYADQLDFYSGRTDLPARTILFHLRTILNVQRHLIRRATLHGFRAEAHQAWNDATVSA
jgi:hypothetical protein